jgi:hypothetical protein
VATHDAKVNEVCEIGLTGVWELPQEQRRAGAGRARILGGRQGRFLRRSFARRGQRKGPGRREGRQGQTEWANAPNRNISCRRSFLKHELAARPLPASDLEELELSRGISNLALGRTKDALKVTASRLPNGRHGANVVHLALPG